MDEKELIAALENILLFNKKVIMRQQFSDEEIKCMKKSCELLTRAGVYRFDINCPWWELLEQIEEFIEDRISDD